MQANMRPIFVRWHGPQGKYDRKVAIVEMGGSTCLLDFTSPAEMMTFAAQLAEMAAKWEKRDELADQLRDSLERVNVTGSLR